MPRRWLVDAAAVMLLALGVFLVHDAAPVSQAGGDTAWNLHLAWSVLTEGDVDLDEWRPVAGSFPHHWYETHERNLLSTFPYGTGVVSAPLVALIGLKEAVLGRSLEDTLSAGIPQAELENTVASFWVALTTAVTFVLLRMRRHGTVLALAVCALFALGSAALSTVSRALWMHGPTMFLLAVVLVLLQVLVGRPHSRRPGPATTVAVLCGAGIGAALALGYVVRPTVVVPAAVVGVAVLVRSRPAAVAAMAAGLPLIGLFLLTNRDLYVAWLPSYYDPRRLDASGTWLLGLAGNLVSPSRGLLVWTPWVAFAILGAIAGVRRRDLVSVTCVAASILYWLVVSRHQPWYAGATIGPRLMADVLPLLVVLTADAVPVLAAAARRHRLAGGAAVAAFGVSCLVAVAIHSRVALRHSVLTWNFEPVPVEEDEGRLWDWSEPQFLR